MKKLYPFLFILGLVATGLLINSCKKDNNSNIPLLLATGTWELASIQVYNYVGDAQIGNPDTLNTTCTSSQYFTFKTDNTCTYTNFACLTQTSTGTYTLTENRLYFTSTMVCKDTVSGVGATGSSIPFSNTQIVNLGVYSLVLQTGDVQPNYSSTKKRRVVRYGFIKQKVTTITN